MNSDKDMLSHLLDSYSNEISYMADVFRMIDADNKDALQDFIRKAKDNLEILQGVIYSIEYEL